MDDPPAVKDITNPLPPKSDFHCTWQALMDQGFEDDDEYF